MDISIKETGISELDDLTELFDQYMVFYKQPSDKQKHKVYLKERIVNNEAKVYLAVDDRKVPIGFVLNYFSFSSVSLGRVVILNDLFVRSDFRGMGVGEKLIRKTFAFARQMDAVRVDLGTAVDNKIAQGLYEKIGFVRDEEFYSYSYSLK